MATNDSKAPIRTVKRVQFGILAPDEIVSINQLRIEFCFNMKYLYGLRYFIKIQKQNLDL